MIWWWVLGIVAYGIVCAINPADMGIVAYKIGLLCLGALMGSWLDWTLFPFDRGVAGVVDPKAPGDWELGESIVFAGAMLRRALIIWTAIEAIGHGL